MSKKSVVKIFHKCFVDASYKQDNLKEHNSNFNVGIVVAKKMFDGQYYIQRDKFIQPKTITNTETGKTIGYVSNSRIAELFGLYKMLKIITERYFLKVENRKRYFYIHCDCIPALFTVRTCFYEYLRNYLRYDELPDKSDYKVYTKLFISEIEDYQKSEVIKTFDPNDKKQYNIINYIMKHIHDLLIKIIENKDLIYIDFFYTPAHVERKTKRERIIPEYIHNYFIRDIQVNSSPIALFFNALADDMADRDDLFFRILGIKGKLPKMLNFTVSVDFLLEISRKIKSLKGFMSKEKIEIKKKVATYLSDKHFSIVAIHNILIVARYREKEITNFSEIHKMQHQIKLLENDFTMMKKL